MKVEYKGKTYEAEDELNLIRMLRFQVRLTHREIGKLIGKSKQRVGQILGPSGRLEFPELDSPYTFYESDESISYRYNIPLSRVSTARRKLGLKQSFKVDLDKRQEWLSLSLFDRKPGPQFVSFLKEQIEKLPEGKCKVLNDFYILGLSQSLSDDVNNDSDRVYRHVARQDLEKLVSEYSIEDLEKRGVVDGRVDFTSD